jgi:hypothetical protein
MPKMKPDRDDRRGGLGLGGAQDGPIGTADEQQRGTEPDGAGAGGEGAQRHPGGSSRDSEILK